MIKNFKKCYICGKIFRSYLKGKRRRVNGINCSPRCSKIYARLTKNNRERLLEMQKLLRFSLKDLE